MTERRESELSESELPIVELSEQCALRLSKAEDDRMLLRLRLALHIPRFTPPATDDYVLPEARRLLSVIRQDQFGLDWRNREAVPDLSKLRVVRFPDAAAKTVHRGFHYLRSGREGLHLAMVPAEWQTDHPPCSLWTFSELDLPHVQRVIDGLGFDPGKCLVLSRSYTFRWAPRNAFSYGFAKCVAFLRDEAYPDLDWLVSYVNLNVGFTGSSYLAAGWSILAREMSPSYTYLDGDYITRRNLRAEYGTGDYGVLSVRLGDRIQRSQIPLEPLLVLAFPVSKAAVEIRKSIERSDIPNRS